MEQPRTLNSSSDPSALPKDKEAATATPPNTNKKRPPSPEQVLAHYESQGLDSRAASLKAISDLQTLLFRSARANTKDRSTTNPTARKLDSLNTRLAILEMKLDSKPGFPESVAIGVASGGILHAIGAAAPHIAAIWNSVKSATKTSS